MIIVKVIKCRYHEDKLVKEQHSLQETAIWCEGGRIPVAGLVPVAGRNVG